MKLTKRKDSKKDWQEFGGNMKTQIEDMIHGKYELLRQRLFKPKDLVLEIVPLLVAKSIHLIFKENVKESFDQIYGMDKAYSD